MTKIETLMRDPYSIYARYILGLKPLDDIDEDFNNADYGTIVHKAVETFCKAFPSKLPADGEAEILKIGAELFKDLNFSQTAAAFWKPRLESALKWFIRRQEERQSGTAQILCEQEGEISFKTEGGDFTLSCTADRIDVGNDGDVTLIDYKTGLLPAKKSVLTGYSPQLRWKPPFYGTTDLKTSKTNPRQPWNIGVCADSRTAERSGRLRQIGKKPKLYPAKRWNV